MIFALLVYLHEGMVQLKAVSCPHFFFYVRFLQRYVQKETESKQACKSNVTATTLATRQKKMAEICSLVKYFIRYANKRKLLWIISLFLWYICLNNILCYFTWLIRLNSKRKRLRASSLYSSLYLVSFTACRWASSKVQWAAETHHGGSAEFIQLLSVRRKL